MQRSCLFHPFIHGTVLINMEFNNKTPINEIKTEHYIAKNQLFSRGFFKIVDKTVDKTCWNRRFSVYLR